MLSTLYPPNPFAVSPAGPAAQPPAYPDRRQVRDEWMTTVFRGPHDKDNYTLEDRQKQDEYLTLLLKEPAVSTALWSLVASVMSLPLKAHPADPTNPNDVYWANFARDAVSALPGGSPALVKNLALGGLVFGFSVNELVFDYPERGKWKDRLVLADMGALDSRYIRFDLDPFKRVVGVRGLKANAGDVFAPDKFAILSHQSLFNSPFGIAQLRSAYRAAKIIESTIKLRTILLENFSGPFISYKSASVANRASGKALLAEARALGYIVCDKQDELEVLNLAQGSDQQFQGAIDDLRKEMYTAIRWGYLPFMESDAGAKVGNTSVQRSMSQLGEWMLATEIATVITEQIVKPLIRLNVGDESVGFPTITLGGQNAADQKAALERFEAGQRLGLRISKRQVQQQGDFEEPSGPDDELGGPQPGMGPDGMPGDGTQPGQGPDGGDGGPGGGNSGPPSDQDKQNLLDAIDAELANRGQGEDKGGKPEPESFSWSPAPTKTGGVKAVGDGEHHGRTLYGAKAQAALRGHADHPKVEEESRKAHGEKLEAKSRARQLSSSVMANTATAADYEELAGHLQHLTTAELRNVRAKVAGSFGGATKKGEQTANLAADVRKKGQDIPKGWAEEEDGKPAAKGVRPTADRTAAPNAEAKPGPAVAAGETSADSPKVARVTAKEPWQMTAAEYQTSGEPNYGDFVSVGGKVGYMKGAGGIGSSRRELVGLNGQSLGHFDATEAKLIRRQGVGSASASGSENALSAEFKAKQAADIKKIEDEHGSAMWKKRHAETMRRALERGDKHVTQKHVDDAYAAISPDEMARAQKAEADIAAVKDRPLVFDDTTADTHRRSVQNALAAGKPVPAEVLKDYPDLAPAPTAPATATPPKPAEIANPAAPATATRPDGTPVEPKPEDVHTVPTGSLKRDPARMQYKVSGIGEKGVTDKYKDSEYKPELSGAVTVWRDPETGEDIVVNGHHRHEMAERSNYPTVNARYVQAKTAAEARSLGAVQNIADGRGTATDAAKYLRDSGQDVEHLRRAGVAVKEGVAEAAGHLKDLNDAAFAKLTAGTLDEGTAVTVAKHVKDPQLQNVLLKKVADNDWTPQQTETAAKKIAAAGKVSKTESTLFGDLTDEHSTFDQEVELETAVKRKLAQAVNDFKAVSNTGRADRVSDAGNVLATGENQKRHAAAAERLERFAREANYVGPVADAIKQSAAELAAATTKKEKDRVHAATLERVNAALDQPAGLGSGSTAATGAVPPVAGGGGAGGGASPAPAAAEPAPAAAEVTTPAPKPAGQTDLFGRPVPKAIPAAKAGQQVTLEDAVRELPEQKADEWAADAGRKITKRAAGGRFQTDDGNWHQVGRAEDGHPVLPIAGPTDDAYAKGEGKGKAAEPEKSKPVAEQPKPEAKSEPAKFVTYPHVTGQLPKLHPRFGEPVQGEIAGFPILNRHTPVGKDGRTLAESVSTKTRKALEEAMSDPEVVQSLKDAGITHFQVAPRKLSTDQRGNWTMAHSAYGGVMFHPTTAEHIAKSPVPERRDGGVKRVIHHEAGHGLWKKATPQQRAAFVAAIKSNPAVLEQVSKIVNVNLPATAFDDSHEAKQNRPYEETFAELNAMRRYAPERYAALPEAVRDAASVMHGAKPAPPPTS